MLLIKMIKKFIKILLIKYFDFRYYGNTKFLDVIKFYFTFNKKFFFINKYVVFPVKSFFIYNFFRTVDDYEKENIKLFEVLSHEFDIFVDIGANFGFFSMLFSSVGKNTTYAIELNPLTYEQLRIITNKNENIKTFNIGISDKTSELNYPKYHLIRMSTKLDSQSFSDLGHKKVETCTVDEFFEKNVIKDQKINNCLVKIDIEGAESKLFKSSNVLIKKHKPFILLELHPKNMSPFEDKKIIKYLKENFYNLYDIEGKLLEINYEEYDNQRFIFCVPENKQNKFEKIKYKILN